MASTRFWVALALLGAFIHVVGWYLVLTSVGRACRTAGPCYSLQTEVLGIVAFLFGGVLSAAVGVAAFQRVSSNSRGPGTCAASAVQPPSWYTGMVATIVCGLPR